MRPWPPNFSLCSAARNARAQISPSQNRKVTTRVTFLFWRRRRDSNSRSRLLRTNDLANRPLQPLGYSSVLTKMSDTRNSGAIRNVGDGHPSIEIRFTQQPLACSSVLCRAVVQILHHCSGTVRVQRLLCHGGEGEIRTLGSFYTTTVFKTVTINHSVTSP